MAKRTTKARPATTEDRAKAYEAEMLSVIKEKRIAFLDHCFGFTSFSKKTAYNHGLHELHTISNAIDENRVKAKNYLLNKWIQGDNPTLQIAAMRLLSDSNEHRKLNQSYVQNDVTVNEDNLKSLKQLFSADDESE